MTTVKDLKNYLQDLLDQLENVDEDVKLHIEYNTYWLKGDFAQIGNQFIDLEQLETIDYKGYEITFGFDGDYHIKGEFWQEYFGSLEQAKEYIDEQEDEE